MRIAVLSLSYLLLYTLMSYVSKLWAVSSQRWYFVAANLFMGVVIALVSMLMIQHSALYVVSLIKVVLGMIASISVGVLVFNEHLSATNKLGVLCGVLAVVLVNWK